MLINELSKRTGVTIHTLRFYENLGLIKGKTDEEVKSNKYKQYDESLIETINWIIASKKAGFTLAEINTLIQDWFNGNMTLVEKMEIAEKKIKEVDLKIKELKEVRRFLLQAKIDVEKGLC
ncbi:DNA-binding transcriptional MerR regulator [Pedobacter cryoconitis]|uniref:DNA-binding transcriptional MerR regulator n=1 Tax=Pedobacter cryoconitis TaxID=188932 RepID=A0A7W8YRC2_9SPHI|nr:MerR family transcriptional regulator [Pedobacter cryoconitis]MBB5620371.1 DNA-binding transcriptional MerR regulator [Pedobacter cryoconitis]